MHLNTEVRTLTAIYLGDIAFGQAVSDRRLVAVGPRDLMVDIHRWFARSRFAETLPASEEERGGRERR